MSIGLEAVVEVMLMAVRLAKGKSLCEVGSDIEKMKPFANCQPLPVKVWQKLSD